MYIQKLKEKNQCSLVLGFSLSSTSYGTRHRELTHALLHQDRESLILVYFGLLRRNRKRGPIGEHFDLLTI